MASRHVLLTEWTQPDFDIERSELEAHDISWSLPEPVMALAPPTREEQEERLLERIEAAPRLDGLMFMLAPITRRVIEALPPECKILQRYGVGLDAIDLEAAKERGIPVQNTPEYCIEEVAVHAMAMLLSLHRQLGATQQRMLAGHWSSVPPLPLPRLSSLTLGILGLGRIGRRFGEMMRPLVKEVVFFDPAVTNAPEWAKSAELDEMFSQSDLVSLHCPLLPTTRGIVNARTLALMKPTAILVNVSRGALVEPEPLAEALRAEKLAGAGLDVFDPEVPAPDSPLRTAPNIALTSHTAWYSEQSVLDCRREAIDKLIAGVLAA